LDLSTAEKFLNFSKKPDLFVQCSQLKYFIKDIKGNLFLNPGSICKGQNVGTYAEVSLARSQENVAKVLYNISILKI